MVDIEKSRRAIARRAALAGLGRWSIICAIVLILALAGLGRPF